MANKIWMREEVQLNRPNTGWQTFTETLEQRRFKGSQKCHKRLKIVAQKHFYTYDSISATYIKPSLFLSLVYCDMRYMRGKFFALMPQHGIVFFFYITALHSLCHVK